MADENAFASFGEAATLKRIIEALVDLATDANLYTDASGIHMQAMDSSHVALCMFIFPPDAMHYFDGKTRVMGVHIKTLHQILRCVRECDMVHLRETETKDHLGLYTSSPNNDACIDVLIPLMSIDVDVLEIPNVEYDVGIQMNSKEFARITKDLVGIGELVQFTGTSNSLVMSTESDSGVSFSIRLERTEETRIVHKEDAHVALGSRYLRHFTKGSAISQDMCIGLTNELPVSFTFQTGHGKLAFMCAPKFDDE